MPSSYNRSALFRTQKTIRSMDKIRHFYFIFNFFLKFIQVISTPNWGSNSLPQDQELHASLTEPARHSNTFNF